MNRARRSRNLNARVTDNTISNNTIDGSDGGGCRGEGGAVSIYGGNRRNSVTDNFVFQGQLLRCVRGGGIYVTGALIEDNLVGGNSISYCHFEGEDSYEGSGGGIYTNGGIVRGNAIIANSARSDEISLVGRWRVQPPAFGGGLYIANGTGVQLIEGNDFATTTGVGWDFPGGGPGTEPAGRRHLRGQPYP
jgi:hypothetical protein